MSQSDEIAILPTSPTNDGKIHTDVALTAIFSAYIALINSERQAIWQRYNILLLANSLIIGFLGNVTKTRLEIMGATIFGIMLCALWCLITIKGYGVFNNYRKVAKNFCWKGCNDINPLRLNINYRMRSDPIYILAIVVIALFVVAYGALGWARYCAAVTAC